MSNDTMERDRQMLTVLLEVLDNPLGVLLAERGRRRDLLREGLALGAVRDDGRASLGRSRDDGHGGRVAGVKDDAGEVVGVVRIPYVLRWRVVLSIGAQGT